VAILQTDVSHYERRPKKVLEIKNYKRNQKQGVNLKLATPSNLAFSLVSEQEYM